MTQLIENKPRRRSLIATLSHFCPSCRYCGWEGSANACVRAGGSASTKTSEPLACPNAPQQRTATHRSVELPASKFQRQEFNRQLSELGTNLNPATSTRVLVLIANFCDNPTYVFLAPGGAAGSISYMRCRRLRFVLNK